MQKTTPKRPSEYMTIPEVAAELGMGTRWTWEQVATGKMPSYRFGSSRRVRRRDLADYIESCRQN